MKLIIVLVAVCFLVAICNGQPIGEFDHELVDPMYQISPNRVKRVTCDVLSVEAKGIKLNDAACGVHCLIRGRSGGYCNGKRVCVCR